MRNPLPFSRLFLSTFFGLILWMGRLCAQEHWSFDDPEIIGGVYSLRPLPRSLGNDQRPADSGISTKTGSKYALGNPSLLLEGKIEPFEIGNASWTLSGWFRHEASSGTMKGTQTLMGTRQSSSKFKGWDLVMLDGAIRFLYSPLRGMGHGFVSAQRYDDQKWHHFQLVWNTSARTVTLWIDGVEAGSAKDVPPDIAFGGRYFTVGTQVLENTMSAIQGWEGEIDEWSYRPEAVDAPSLR